MNATDSVANEIIQRTAIGADTMSLGTIFGVVVIVIVGLIIIFKSKEIIGNTLYNYIKPKIDTAITTAVTDVKKTLRDEQNTQFKELKSEMSQTRSDVNRINSNIERLSGVLEGYFKREDLKK